MRYRNQKTGASHFGLYRQDWRLKCYEELIFFGKIQRKLLSIISVHVISVFSYSWILCLFHSKNYLVKYLTFMTKKHKDPTCDICYKLSQVGKHS